VGATGQGDDFTTTSIQVDIDDLAEFRGFWGRELNANLRPGSEEILTDHLMGVRFGVRNAGGNVSDAVKAYFQALSVSAENLHQYIVTSERMIELIAKVQDAYRSADLTAAGSAPDLDTVLSDMVAASTKAAADYPGSETNREAYRGSGNAAVSPA
jgi:hypothetical protein